MVLSAASSRACIWLPSSSTPVTFTSTTFPDRSIVLCRTTPSRTGSTVTNDDSVAPGIESGWKRHSVSRRKGR